MPYSYGRHHNPTWTAYEAALTELEKAAAEPGVTYISLPALASSADLRMMGRVVRAQMERMEGAASQPAAAFVPAPSMAMAAG